jgi:hypothetical protein
MAKTRTLLLLSFLLLVLGSGSAVAQERELLYPTSVSGKLQEITGKIRNLKSEITPCDQLTRKTDYFVRVAPRKYIFEEDGKLKDEARLGSKPYVFVTTAESVFGLSLLDIYVGIGYEAEDIIRAQRDEEMVMIVFQYPKEIVTSDITNGLLPDDWDRKVYIPTWENIFSLFHRLATLEPGRRKELAPERTLVMSQAERDFVSGFSVEAKQRITKAAYAELKAAGGTDWKYRNLLEQKLSVFEHFRGNGRTQNEVRDPEGMEAGLVEFVGPNWKVRELPEVAIIHLGKLIMKDTYGAACTLCRGAR